MNAMMPRPGAGGMLARCALGAAMGMALLPCTLVAQPDTDAVKNVTNLRRYLSALQTQRVAVGQWGDSNELFAGQGNSWGEELALSQLFGLHGTGVVMGSRYGIGGNPGSYEFGPGVNTQSAARSGAPGGFGNLFAAGVFELGSWQPRGGWRAGYVYGASEGLVAANAVILGLRNNPDLFGLRDSLTYRIVYGRFPGATSSFRPGVRASNFALLSWGPDVSFAGPLGTLGTHDFTLGADPTRTLGLEFGVNIPNGPGVSAPYLFGFEQIWNNARLSGAAATTLYAAGGHSLRDVCSFITVDAQLGNITEVFRQMRAPAEVAGQEPLVVMRLMFGLNDRIEDLPSYTQMILPGNSPAAYRDNLQYVVQRLRTAWAGGGWPADRLIFMIVRSHRTVTDAPVDDPQLEGFWQQIVSFAQANPADTIAVDPSRIVVSMPAFYYWAGFDQNHLSNVGYDRTWRAYYDYFKAIVACDDVDFNGDGIEQDPTDIEAFLSVYSGGPCIPGGASCGDIDFNNDGIQQDPTDIEAFLNAYSGGVCL